MPGVSNVIFGAIPVVAVVLLGTSIVHERAAESSLRAQLVAAGVRQRTLQKELSRLEESLDGDTASGDPAGFLDPDAPQHFTRADVAGMVQHAVLPSGDDIGNGYRLLPVAKAVELCAGIGNCKGITYLSEAGEDVPEGPVKVFFKSAWRPRPAGDWRAILRPTHGSPRRTAQTLAIDPGYPLYAKYKHLIRAEYDVEPIAKHGHRAHWAQWPEYNVSRERAVFQYPAPSEHLLPVSVSPMVYYIPAMLTRQQAQDVIDVAGPRLERSQVARGKTDANESHVDNVRTSEGAWLNDNDPAALVLRKRIEEITGRSRADFELLQVLRYETGQKYGSHVDYFHPSTYGDAKSNRMATLITFLSDVEVGGGTVFPKAMGSNVEERRDRVDCDSGVQIAPRQGSAVLFYNMRPDMVFDPASRHGGCPVGEGQHKWVAVQWIRFAFSEDGHPPIAKF